MEWNEKLQKIIDYVENHIQREQEPIDQEEISKIAGCSFGFFQKVFSYMNGISFAEYVRLRKLTLASYDLKNKNLRVIDISYQYGYDSPTSFTKAFQQFHGVTPSEARHLNTKLKVVSKMQICNQQQYSWRLELKPAFRLIGKRFVYCKGEQGEKIPEFWSKCQRDGTFSYLVSLDQGAPQGTFGVFDQGESDLEELGYSIMVVSDCKIPEGYKEIIIPETTWAIIECKGPVPKAIQNGWKYLYEEWLIQYPFLHANCPEIEWYSSGNCYDKQYLSQIWIPIIYK